MTPEEFRAWSQQLLPSKESEALIAAMRYSPRERPCQQCHPSPKMKCSIQFESQHVELWAIYVLERDDDVLEYYDQASHISLSYHAKLGRQTTQWYTPVSIRA